METTVKERLISFLSYKKIGQKKFADTCGLSAGFVNAIKNSIQPKTIHSISIAYPDLNTGWLLTGEGEMIKGSVVSEPRPTYSKPDKSIPMIPFDAVAGYDGLDHDGIVLSRCAKYSVPDFSDKGAEFVIRVSGNSMYPKYSNGDILACRKVHEILFFQWGKDYVIDSSQGTMIKRIYEVSDNSELIRLYSDNKEFYPEFVMPKSDIRSLSIVVGLIRTE